MMIVLCKDSLEKLQIGFAIYTELFLLLPKHTGDFELNATYGERAIAIRYFLAVQF